MTGRRYLLALGGYMLTLTGVALNASVARDSVPLWAAVGSVSALWLGGYLVGLLVSL